MDKISLGGLVFWGRHGVFSSEKEKAQPFELDLDLYLDLSVAGRSDRLEDTIDYAAVFSLARQTVEETSHNLLEAVAEELATGILRECGNGRLKEVSVRIRKVQAPLPGTFRKAEVEIKRQA